MIYSFLGPGGSGKTTIVALLKHLGFVANFYDADPAKDLIRFAGADEFQGSVLSPAVIDFPLLEYSFFAIPENSEVVIVTTPNRLQIEKTRVIIEDLREAGRRIRGIVVNKCSKGYEKVAASLNLELIGNIRYSEEVEDQGIAYDHISEFKVNSQLEEEIRRIGEKLQLVSRIEPEKKGWLPWKR